MINQEMFQTLIVRIVVQYALQRATNLSEVLLHHPKKKCSKRKVHADVGGSSA